jgi:hypothetical protein
MNAALFAKVDKAKEPARRPEPDHHSIRAAGASPAALSIYVLQEDGHAVEANHENHRAFYNAGCNMFSG